MEARKRTEPNQGDPASRARSAEGGICRVSWAGRWTADGDWGRSYAAPGVGEEGGPFARLAAENACQNVGKGSQPD